MIARRLLYLDPRQLRAYIWQDGSLACEGSFTASPDDLAAFRTYLASCRRSQFRILANLGEESQRVESIPYLLGRDRQALIDRKLGQFFPGKAMATVTSLGYEKSQRKNERLLLTALTNPAQFAPWLDCLTKSEAPLAGLYSLSQLGGDLLTKLRIRSKRCLLLSVQDHSIRESFLVDGRAIFSRLAPLPEPGMDAIASALAAEALRLQHYLLAQRQIGRDDALPVFIIAHPDSVKAVQDACGHSGKLAPTVLDSREAARALGFKASLPDDRSEALFLHLLAIRRPSQQFAHGECRHAYHLLQMKRLLAGIGAVLPLAAILLSAAQFYDSHVLHRQSMEFETRTVQVNRRHQEIREGFPKLGIDSEALRSFGNRLARLQETPSHPQAALELVSQALGRAPAVEIDSIDWRDDASADEGGAIPDVPAGERTVVQGSIRLGQDATPRQVIAAFEQFVEALRKTPATRIEVMRKPIEMDSSHTLKGGNREEAQPERSFAVEIRRALRT